MISRTATHEDCPAVAPALEQEGSALRSGSMHPFIRAVFLIVLLHSSIGGDKDMHEQERRSRSSLGEVKKVRGSHGAHFRLESL